MQDIKMSQRQSVVLVPAPFEGHITPMLQLGYILHSRGFSIIVAHSEFNSPNTENHPHFVFVSLPDNTSGLDKSFNNLYAVITSININCGAPLEEYLVQLMEKKEVHGQIVCIIYDNVMYFIDSVANHLKLPSIVMRPNSAAYLLADHITLRLHAENRLPITESQVHEEIPGFHPFRFKDIPTSLTSIISQHAIDFFDAITNIGSSRAVIYNTISDLEGSLLSQLQQHYQVPFFCIGPFHKIAPPSETSLLKEDNSCIAWLDKQSPNSVLYVSFGSLATMDEKELMEIAWGLVKSEQLFLWVVRSDSVGEPKWLEKLPEDIQQVIKERGCIVKWAPQKEVLSHSAVGGFWSHCGWNSTLESICQGIPMICRPFFSDQKLNTRYVTHVWKTGLEMECALEREVIEKAIRTLMVDFEGKEMKKRVIELKQKLEACLEKGGSSYKDLDDLTEFITSLSVDK